MVLGGQELFGRPHALEVRANVRGRGHRAVPGRFHGAERQVADAGVAIAGVVRVEHVHDEDFNQRVSAFKGFFFTLSPRTHGRRRNTNTGPNGNGCQT